MLHIENLLKKYGEKIILDITNLDLPQGIVHLKGINGSGKTTFSKIMAGLIPFQGKILLHNHLQPDKDKIKYRRQVNYAESEPIYPDFVTANDLIEFVGRAKGATSNQKKSNIELFGINEYLFDPVGTYSSGMLKRLSLCLAFLGQPSLVLLDEPFNTLDTSAIDLLIRHIHHTNKGGVHFILVSHQDVQQLGVHIDATFLVENKTIRRV